jgi:hypothetical protein
LNLEKMIEKLRELKSELDSAFDQGRIDLDKISSGLEEVAADLESLGRSYAMDKTTAPNRLPLKSSVISALKMQNVAVADYR